MTVLNWFRYPFSSMHWPKLVRTLYVDLPISELRSVQCTSGLVQCIQYTSFSTRWFPKSGKWHIQLTWPSLCSLVRVCCTLNVQHAGRYLIFAHVISQLSLPLFYILTRQHSNFQRACPSSYSLPCPSKEYSHFQSRRFTFKLTYVGLISAHNILEMPRLWW